MERVIVRIENKKGFIEYGQPLLIFVDAPASNGQVLYCAYTGHGEGDYSALIQQTRPATEEELNNLWLYDYNLKNFKIVKKFIRK